MGEIHATVYKGLLENCNRNEQRTSEVMRCIKEDICKDTLCAILAGIKTKLYLLPAF